MFIELTMADNDGTPRENLLINTSHILRVSAPSSGRGSIVWMVTAPNFHVIEGYEGIKFLLAEGGEFKGETDVLGE